MMILMLMLMLMLTLIVIEIKDPMIPLIPRTQFPNICLYVLDDIFVSGLYHFTKDTAHSFFSILGILYKEIL